MDNRLLLVKSITLLFQESQIDPSPDTISRKLVGELLEKIQLPESAVDDGAERNVLSSLRSTLVWMLGSKDSQPYDKTELLQRLRVNVGKDDKLYEAFLEGIRDYSDEAKLRDTIAKGRRSVKGYIDRERVKSILKKASHAATFKENDIGDWALFIQKTTKELIAIDMGDDPKNDGSFVSSIDLSDAKSVAAAVEDMAVSLSDEGKIHLPWKRANAMMGEQMGVRRGEFHLMNALPHNYKSGWLLDVFIGICLFNTPYVFDKERKPAVILFSTEDDMPVILQKIHTALVQYYENVPVKRGSFTQEQITEYVMSKLRARGWNVFIHRVRPSMFTYAKYIATLEDYKSRGYEVCAVVCDYLSMFNKEGCNSGSTGDDLQDLYRRVREYTSANKIAHFTAHQLSTEAKALKRVDEEDFINKLPGKGYYEGCRKLDTEVDFEAYVNKRDHRDGTFLEILWGKHRKVGSTSDKDKYFVLKFYDYPMYGVRYDYEGDIDLGYDKVGGRPASQGGGKQYHDLDF